jgi:hypothetical protein
VVVRPGLPEHVGEIDTEDLGAAEQPRDRTEVVGLGQPERGVAAERDVEGTVAVLAVKAVVPGPVQPQEAGGVLATLEGPGVVGVPNVVVPSPPVVGGEGTERALDVVAHGTVEGHELLVRVGKHGPADHVPFGKVEEHRA